MQDVSRQNAGSNIQIELKCFCTLGALCASFTTLLLISRLLLFNPPLYQFLHLGLAITASLFAVYINIVASLTPWGVVTRRARAYGVLLTICTLVALTAPLVYLWAIFFNSVTSIIPWASAVSGLGLWQPREKWRASITSGALWGLLLLACHFTYLSMSIYERLHPQPGEQGNFND